MTGALWPVSSKAIQFAKSAILSAHSSCRAKRGGVRLDVLCPCLRCAVRHCQIAGVHFVLRRRNAGNFELVSLISKSHATVVSVPGGGIILCYICCLLSYNSKSNARKNGSIVSKHERIPKWMCVSEKLGQGLVVRFTID